jgi:TRL (tRNA-associated locus)-like protein
MYIKFFYRKVKKMKLILLIISLLGFLLISGCSAYRAPVQPPMGVLFQSTTAPLDTNVESTEMSDKSGEASASTILGLFSFGDCGVKKAAEDGNISVVKHADYNYLNVLGIYQKFTTIAYGE